MFRIELFCDDKKVGDILRFLTGIAIGTPIVQPIINADVKNGKVVAQTSGDLVDMFLYWLRQNKLTEFTAKHAQEFVVSIGKPIESYAYLVQKGKDIGAWKKLGKGTVSKYWVSHDNA